MLLQHVAGLSRARIVLASGSPRRRELLGSMGLKFEVCVSTFEETLPHDKFERAEEYALETGDGCACNLGGLQGTLCCAVQCCAALID